MRFNINNHVRVKLTDYGRRALRKWHDDLYWRSANPPEYHPPKEDADGWSQWQLWDLMAKLGPSISMSMVVPFETEIELETDDS